MVWANYGNTGPFTNNAAPSLSATLFNNIESFLDQFTGSVVADNNISADGSGDLTVKKLVFTLGSIARIAQFSGSGSGLKNHNLGAVPDICLIGYAGNFSISTLQPITWWSPNSSQVNVNATGTFSWVGLALKWTP